MSLLPNIILSGGKLCSGHDTLEISVLGGLDIVSAASLNELSFLSIVVCLAFILQIATYVRVFLCEVPGHEVLDSLEECQLCISNLGGRPLTKQKSIQISYDFLNKVPKLYFDFQFD